MGVFDDKSPEEHRQYLVQLGEIVEKHYWKLRAAFAGGANHFSVKQTSAMSEILTYIGEVRDLMEVLLKERRGANIEKCHEVLKKVFAEDDGYLISKLRVFIDGAKDVMGQSQYGQAHCLDDCLKQLLIVEDILKQKFKMEEKMIAAKRKLQSARAEPLSEEQVKALLDAIDVADDPAEEIINKVFDAHVLPGENVVRGEGKKRLTQILIEHVSRESKERASRLKIPILAREPSQCKDFVEQCLDPDGDGSVTREEAREGLAKALDDIDPPKEFQKKKSFLAAKRLTHVKTLLELIDEADAAPEEIINKVFDAHALPGENVVRVKARMLTQVVAEHVSRESKERASRLGIPS